MAEAELPHVMRALSDNFVLLEIVREQAFATFSKVLYSLH